MLVATGSIVRERRVHIPLINLLCDHGADLGPALQAAVLLGEPEAAQALIARGAPITLPVAAGLGLTADFARLLPASTPAERHLALTMAADSNHLEAIRLLLESGEDPNRNNPAGGHSHATPLHQAAMHGYTAIAQLLTAHGARLDMRDLLFDGTPAGWAHHNNQPEMEAWLRAQEVAPCPRRSIP